MPYKVKSSWRFDDARAGLVGEPFVAGIPEMIEMLVADIPDAENGFQLFFSTKPFPDYSAKLVWQRGSEEGNWYYCEEFQSEGWLCPALFKYYREAPREIYVKAEAK
ncbi:MAG: hypothetical protein JXA52_01185 [Planctomycetes bacterium]|nr:hypothetical protein [Planctomycetota bacterium]